ncbi:MAG: DsrE family protein [Sulfurospirillaceae bacterium]|nr:DsrE family protein [Sulfurospirillaceae bacterium]
MKNELMVVWTTDNKETIHNMVFLYTLNAKLKGWFDEVTLLIWGASQKILSEDKEIQAKIKEMSDVGVKVQACQKCSENLEIKDALQSCGVEVFYTGVLLSDWLKSGKPILTF